MSNTASTSDKAFEFVLDNLEDEQRYTSELRFHNFRLIWNIEDFPSMCKNAEEFESPRFPSKKFGTKQCQWYLTFQPVELKDGNEEKFRIKLSNTESSPEHVNVRISFYSSFERKYSFVSDLEGRIKNDHPMTWIKTGCHFYQILLCGNSLPRKITVICELQVFDSAINILERPMIKRFKFGSIHQQLESLFDDQVLKDVTFTVMEKQFTAHKAILTLRSPVFAAMFRSKMSEELTSVVEVNDIKSVIFEKVLRFIYTDKVDNLEESALDLLYAAEKYELEYLKSMCVNSLYKNISQKTVLKTLELADLYSILNLKEKCLDYLILNIQPFKIKEEFEELMKNCPHLAIEMVERQKIGNNENQADQLCEKMNFTFRNKF